jgi:hypothetical protein
MRFRPLAFVAQTALTILLSQGITANADEIKILSTHAAMEVLSELGPQFERSTGRKLSFSYDPANIIKRQIEGGSAFDIAIVTRGVIDDLANAREEHLGMGPIRFLASRRMNLVDRALMQADDASSTVTAVATDHGFWELGRFSVAYRALFGEKPSATLHRRPHDRVSSAKKCGIQFQRPPAS